MDHSKRIMHATYLIIIHETGPEIKLATFGLVDEFSTKEGNLLLTLLTTELTLENNHNSHSEHIHKQPHGLGIAVKAQSYEYIWKKGLD